MNLKLYIWMFVDNLCLDWTLDFCMDIFQVARIVVKDYGSDLINLNFCMGVFQVAKIVVKDYGTAWSNQVTRSSLQLDSR